MNKPIRRDILKDWDVLVLDDEPDSLEVATRVLRFYGAKVHSGSDGKAGLELLRGMNPLPRFVISDLSMPVMDGWAFIYEVKHDPALQHLPVIALTAHAMAGDRERGLAAGFHNYITKPLSPATFMGDLLTLLVERPEFSALLA